MSYEKQSTYDKAIEEVANFFEESIKNNNAVWRKGWGTDYAIAHNPYTGSIYSGHNEYFVYLNTLMKGYSSNAYLTFKNIKELGGSVKKGETSISLFKFSAMPLTEKDKQLKIEKYKKEHNKEPSQQFLDKLEYETKKVFSDFRVFNLDQCEGIDLKKLKEHQEKKGFLKTLENFAEEKKWKNIEVVEEIIKNSNIEIKNNGVGRAFYSPEKDYISMPNQNEFKDEKSYYATILHELGHATGHKSRLDRNFSGKQDENYAQEELRAEIFSYLQGKKLNLEFDFGNHISYLESWQKTAKDGIKEAVKDAFKISNYVEKNWYPKKEKELKQKQNNEIKIPIPKYSFKNKEQSHSRGRTRGR